MTPKFNIAAILALVCTMAAPAFAYAQEGFAGYPSAFGLLSARDGAGSWPQPQMSDFNSNGLASFRQGVFNGSVHDAHTGTIRDRTDHKGVAWN